MVKYLFFRTKESGSDFSAAPPPLHAGESPGGGSASTQYFQCSSTERCSKKNPAVRLSEGASDFQEDFAGAFDRQLGDRSHAVAELREGG